MTAEQTPIEETTLEGIPGTDGRQEPAAGPAPDDDVRDRLRAAEAERDELLSNLQRVAADFDNYRKRVARDQGSLVARANERLVKELLPVLDDLGRAAQPPVRASGPGEGVRGAAQPPVRVSGPGEGVRGNRVEVPPANDTGAIAGEGARTDRVEIEPTNDADPTDDQALLEGIRLIHRSLADALAREGLVEIETSGRFDPHVHEALLTQPSEAEEGSIIQVVQKGYSLGDRVLRPARVVVAAPLPAEG